MKDKVDTLIINTSELVTLHSKAPRRGKEMEELGIIRNGALAIRGKRIIAVGTTSAIKNSYKASKIINAKGKVITPGLIDTHTHLVFFGSREDEFEMRIKGIPYMEIAKKGGGIVSTVEKVRQASKKQLKANAKKYLNEMLKYGTTTCEVKSGYGLNLKDEIKCLEVIKDLDDEQPIDLIPTFLGAHDIPKEYKNKKKEYIKLIINEMIPIVAKRKLAKFCDVFCEKGVFDVDEAREILNASKCYGLIPKLHVEEFTTLGSVELAVEVEAISCDHLLCISKNGISTLRNSKTIAILLPGTVFFLGLQKYAPARKLIDKGVAVALGSDFNPGSCMTFNLQLIMTIASTQMKMTPAEVLIATTINAAYALDIDNEKGSLEPGKIADIIIWNAPTYKYIPYFFGTNQVDMVFKDGKIKR